MTDIQARGGLSSEDLATLLEVTRSLAAPFDVMSMLAAVTAAARQVLRAERCSVWLHDAVAGELVLEVSTDLQRVRMPVGVGLVGTCARDRRILNVPDCYADPRFDQQVDRRSGFRTRCSLTLPLIDHADALVGVMQVLNRIGGTFEPVDEQLATALAAQCAVALQRVRMIESLIEGEKLRREMEMAQVVQMSTLPQAMPALAGYDVHGTFRPALLTGGDTFDLALVGDSLLVVLGDATGHGIAPAMSVTQMHAMLRMALRLGADLETAFVHVNDLLAETLAADRFVTAFIGLLDPLRHVVRYISAGQGPILHFHAARAACSRHKPTSFPLGAMALPKPRPAVEMFLAPGDVLLLLSDGIYEYVNSQGEAFGEDRVQDIVARHRNGSMASLSAAILEALQGFAAGAPQEDDITVVLVRREAAP
jgi:phosphoserine phosphatase RsbU/P